MTRSVYLFVLGLLAVGCSTTDRGRSDASTVDASQEDAPTTDGGSDAGPTRSLIPIVVSANGMRLETEAGERFYAVGFNYTTSGDKLIEELWYDAWSTIERDFTYMNSLGANVVRIHLQVPALMASATKMRQEALDKLVALAALAHRTGLYLHVTGLGLYRPSADPVWYGELSEEARWDAQALFWREVANTLRGESSVLCFDLMNEPVVATGEDWTPGAFGGYSFIQHIVLDVRGRDTQELSAAWILKLTSAIKSVDAERLVTVGSLPFLGGAFAPAHVAPYLDVLSPHIYPEREMVDEAIAIVDGFNVGLPVLVGETGNVHVDVDELEVFVRGSIDQSVGVLGHYLGTPVVDLTPPQTIPEALQRDQLVLFEQLAAEFAAPAQQ